MKISLSFLIFAALVGLTLSVNLYGSQYGYDYGRRVCNAPISPRYGGYTGSVNSYNIGHRITYYCNDGYELYGSRYSTCQYSSRTNYGYWDISAPDCRSSRKICPKLDKPKNGVVKQTGVYPGDKAVYKCNDGLLMFGKYTRTCLKNGVWSDSAPVCQRIRCPNSNAPVNGRVRTSGYYPSDHAYYDCAYGYRLEGSSHRVCTNQGSWTGDDPVCVSNYYLYGNYYYYDTRIKKY